ncbi:hypothetical protein ACFT5C_34745 [Streptomyces sp. NPDC057116]|uniref:hypothetical protein n=1 Tax=Streptomyces sp. NPDC057116 TaxID=3346023 RepID=UPI00363CFF22
MDLESVTDELYGLRPDRFTTARNARVAEARKAGDRQLADAVRALRRPTLAAWASNLLVRERPEEALSLTTLGEGLRRAHHELDGERLRELSRQQHVLVTALAREARQLAAEAGQPVGEDVQYEVEATLHAVLADPAAAEEWAAGRLVKPLAAPVGFTAALTDVPAPSAGRAARGGEGQGAGTEERWVEERAGRRPEETAGAGAGTGTGARAGKPRAGGTARAQKASREEERERREHAAREEERERREHAAREEERERREHAAREEERERREHAAREEARRAEEEARLREEERERAEAAEERAEEESREAGRRVDALAGELKEAEAHRRTAEEGVRSARRLLREADRAARAARRRARDAAARAERQAAR